MNYRHIYHAGNFADLFKHIILMLLLKSLSSKANPFCYVDTHAGLGIYDLQSQLAQKTVEYLLGVSRVLNYRDEVIPEELSPYFRVIAELNRPVITSPFTGEQLRFYPGSSFLARSLLRSCDRMILMELHPEDVLALKQVFKQDKQVAVHHYDGYLGLKAFLPPQAKRGLVLIDPPFEQKNEFEQVLIGLKTAYSRFKAGIYAVWYPIKDFTLVDNFRRSLIKLGFPHLISEMTISKQTALKEFVGCGMAIINPPWQLDLKLNKILPWLWRVLSPRLAGGVKVMMSKPLVEL